MAPATVVSTCCVVAADELPNVPHLELETMGNYAKAKVKETILAVTRG
jgi:hypothetical protein